jgi:hypothetical protein
MLKPGKFLANRPRPNLVRIRGEAMLGRDVFEEPFAARRDQMIGARRVSAGGTARARQ